MARRLVIASLAVAIAAAAGAPAALADADPASDVLFTSDAFVPYSPPPAKDSTKQLSAAIKAVKQENHAVKVAVIATETDLGGIPQLYGKPQQYATFLNQEIKLTLLYKDTILIVMPQGYGVSGSGESQARSVVAGLGKPGTRNANTLVKQAATAVQKLDKAGALAKTSSGAKKTASSHPKSVGSKLKLDNGSDSGGGGGLPAWLLVAIAVALVGAAGVIVWRVRRRTPA
ncbi:MAG: hypothetical protein ACJ766_12455 [Thermoleophilaceae bacterium]